MGSYESACQTAAEDLQDLPDFQACLELFEDIISAIDTVGSMFGLGGNVGTSIVSAVGGGGLMGGHAGNPKMLPAYIGCFLDENKWTVRMKAPFPIWNELTCSRSCATYTNFAIQNYGRTCSCGNGFGTAKQLPNVKCNLHATYGSVEQRGLGRPAIDAVFFNTANLFLRPPGKNAFDGVRWTGLQIQLIREARQFILGNTLMRPLILEYLVASGAVLKFKLGGSSASGST